MTTLVPILLATLLRATPEADVRRTLAALDRAWNAHDMKAFASHFTPDADLVNPVGMRWKGRASVERALTAFHRTMFKDSVTGTLKSDVRFVAPHVAVAVSQGHSSAYVTPGGRRVPASDERATYVLVEKGGRWLIASGQITMIDPVAAKHDPAARR